MSDTKREISPPLPAGTMAALAVTTPVEELSVETTGCACPVGHTVRNPRPPCGTAVMLSEYAWAVDGMPHELDCRGNARPTPPVREGPPSGPAALRVSAMRHGVSG